MASRRASRRSAQLKCRMRAPSPWSRYRDFSDILRHLVALLYRRPLGDCHIPALHIGIVVEVDGLPFVARDPGPYGDVGNRIIIGDEFAPVEPAIKNTVEAMRLLEVALLGVGRL